MEKKEKNQAARKETAMAVVPPKRRPVHEVKLAFNGGILIGSIWRHQDDKNHSYYTVSLNRSHKDTTTNKWTYGDFFSRDELLGLIRVIEVAHGHIVTGNFDGGNNNE